MTERRLPGGRTFGAVRVGDEVRRPTQPWTATVHSVLRHLEDAGFGGAPRARGFDDQGRERLTFLPGQTLGETQPWPDWLRSDDALRQVGAWLRRLHDATATFRPAADAVWFTGRPWRPGLLIAHLDASPWNAVWADGSLAGFVDWDTASPSRREDDLAFSALTWVPLLTAEIAGRAGFGDAADRHRRFHLLLDAYGYTGDRTAIRDAIIGRAGRNAAMIRQLADGGKPAGDDGAGGHRFGEHLAARPRVVAPVEQVEQAEPADAQRRVHAVVRPGDVAVQGHGHVQPDDRHRLSPPAARGSAGAARPARPGHGAVRARYGRAACPRTADGPARAGPGLAATPSRPAGRRAGTAAQSRRRAAGCRGRRPRPWPARRRIGCRR